MFKMFKNFQMFKLVLEKAEESEIKLPTSKEMATRSSILAWKILASFNFMASVIVHSDFEAQENKVSHCFHCFPIYLL